VVVEPKREVSSEGSIGGYWLPQDSQGIIKAMFFIVSGGVVKVVLARFETVAITGC
jgi:hypothetical protein